jgi:hypothetical protein
MSIHKVRYFPVLLILVLTFFFMVLFLIVCRNKNNNEVVVHEDFVECTISQLIAMGKSAACGVNTEGLCRDLTQAPSICSEPVLTNPNQEQRVQLWKAMDDIRIHMHRLRGGSGEYGDQSASYYGDDNNAIVSIITALGGDDELTKFRPSTEVDKIISIRNLVHEIALIQSCKSLPTMYGDIPVCAGYSSVSAPAANTDKLYADVKAYITSLNAAEKAALLLSTKNYVQSHFFKEITLSSGEKRNLQVYLSPAQRIINSFVIGMLEGKHRCNQWRGEGGKTCQTGHKVLEGVTEVTDGDFNTKCCSSTLQTCQELGATYNLNCDGGEMVSALFQPNNVPAPLFKSRCCFNKCSDVYRVPPEGKFHACGDEPADWYTRTFKCSNTSCSPDTYQSDCCSIPQNRVCKASDCIDFNHVEGKPYRLKEDPPTLAQTDLTYNSANTNAVRDICCENGEADVTTEVAGKYTLTPACLIMSDEQFITLAKWRISQDIRCPESDRQSLEGDVAQIANRNCLGYAGLYSNSAFYHYLSTIRSIPNYRSNLWKMLGEIRKFQLKVLNKTEENAFEQDLNDSNPDVNWVAYYLQTEICNLNLIGENVRTLMGQPTELYKLFLSNDTLGNTPIPVISLQTILPHLAIQKYCLDNSISSASLCTDTKTKLRSDSYLRKLFDQLVEDTKSLDDSIIASMQIALNSLADDLQLDIPDDFLSSWKPVTS